MNEIQYLSRTAQWVHVSKMLDLYRRESEGAFVIISVSKTQNGWRQVVLEIVA